MVRAARGSLTDIHDQTTSRLMYSLAFLLRDSRTTSSDSHQCRRRTSDKLLRLRNLRHSKTAAIEREVFPTGSPRAGGTRRARGNVHGSRSSGNRPGEPVNPLAPQVRGDRFRSMPTARVYLGSYNFSEPRPTTENGENLLLINDRTGRRGVHGRGRPHLRPLRVPREAGGREDQGRCTPVAMPPSTPARRPGGSATTPNRL